MTAGRAGPAEPGGNASDGAAAGNGGPDGAATAGAGTAGAGTAGGAVAGGPDVPAAAGVVFGEALPGAVRYAQLLAGPGVERGIIGPAEAGRIWDRHLLNCAAIARLVPSRASVADVGSGAGLPGIVLALLLPSARVTLVESLARRATFLEECVAELELANTEVVRGRAEELSGQVAADVVTARAVAPLDRLAALCLGLLRPGGRVLAMKGASAEAELARARPALMRLGVTEARVTTVSGADAAATATVVVLSGRSDGHEPARGGRAGGRTGSRPATRPGGSGTGGPAAGRLARPNSRRGGG
jgi:16S rRNA (guanine527-N7)-methyltransferase